MRSFVSFLETVQTQYIYCFTSSKSLIFVNICWGSPLDCIKHITTRACEHFVKALLVKRSFTKDCIPFSFLISVLAFWNLGCKNIHGEWPLLECYIIMYPCYLIAIFAFVCKQNSDVNQGRACFICFRYCCTFHLLQSQILKLFKLF